VRAKVSYFYETLKIFKDFSRENHGHGDHEHGVCRGVFGGKLSFKKMSAGVRLCTLQEKPHFWVLMIKVRPPDGIYNEFQVYRENPLLGFLAVLLACCCSGFAGAYFERVLKKSNALCAGGSNSLWLRNVQLSLLSIPLAIAVSYGHNQQEISQYGFFVGYDSFVWFMVAVKALGGLIVGLAIKYANNVLKDLATSLAMVVGCLANVFLFEIQLNAQFVTGTAVVIASLFLYGYKSNEQHDAALVNSRDGKPRSISDVTDEDSGDTSPLLLSDSEEEVDQQLIIVNITDKPDKSSGNKSHKEILAIPQN
jgi:UDP-galactose transporter